MRRFFASSLLLSSALVALPHCTADFKDAGACHAISSSICGYLERCSSQPGLDVEECTTQFSASCNENTSPVGLGAEDSRGCLDAIDEAGCGDRMPDECDGIREGLECDEFFGGGSSNQVCQFLPQDGGNLPGGR